MTKDIRLVQQVAGHADISTGTYEIVDSNNCLVTGDPDSSYGLNLDDVEKRADE